MLDFSRVTDRLFVGANVNGSEDAAELKAAGVTHVIDCNTDDETSFFPPSGNIVLLQNPTEDDGQQKPTIWFERSLDFAMPAIAHPARTVFVHCAAGVNRGPSTGYAILRALGWTREAAFDLIHARRPQTIGGIRYAADSDRALLALCWTTS